MQVIRSILGFIAISLFIIWGCAQIYFSLESNTPDNSNSGFLEIIGDLIIYIIIIVLMLILIIPTFIYGLIHDLLFTTDPLADNISMFYVIVPCGFLWITLIYLPYSIESVKERRKENDRKETEASEKIKRKKETEKTARLANEYRKMNNAYEEFYDYFKRLNPIVLSTNSWSHINYYNDIYESLIKLKNHCSAKEDWTNFYKMLDSLKKRLEELESWAIDFNKAARDSNKDTSSPNNEKEETDPYVILGISKEMSNQEIKKKYYELISKYHPDKVDNLGNEFKLIAEKMTKTINNAYSIIKQDLKGKGKNE